MIIEINPLADARPCFPAVGVGFQMDLLIFDRAPQPLDEDVVQEAAAAVHRDRDPGRQQLAGERGAGELRALVGVEYARRAVTRQRLLQRLDAEPAVHRVRQPPGQHRAARPVDHRHQIQKAVRHRNVGDVGGPDVVRLRDRQVAKKIRIYLVFRSGLARAGAWDQGFEPHQAHQPLHPLAIDAAAFLVERERHPPRTVKRLAQIEFVDPAHQDQIFRVGLGPRAINPGARHVQQRALPPHRKIRADALDLRPSLRRAHRLGLLAKKSLSTVNWPILA